jgi:hypothetical protein
MAFTRERLEPEQYYFDTRTGKHFYSPDGIGVYWYEHAQEMRESIGLRDETILPVCTSKYF